MLDELPSTCTYYLVALPRYLPAHLGKISLFSETAGVYADWLSRPVSIWAVFLQLATIINWNYFLNWSLVYIVGANLFPCYVFGGTSFFNNLATGDGYLSKFSRKMQMGLTIFYGHFGKLCSDSFDFFKKVAHYF